MDFDHLTLTGGGFAQLSSFWVYTDSIAAGYLGSQVCLMTAGVSVNDTIITLSLSDTFGYLIVAALQRTGGIRVVEMVVWGVVRQISSTLLPPSVPIVSIWSVINEKFFMTTVSQPWCTGKEHD